MFRELKNAVVMLFVLTLVTGVAYPLVVTGIAQVVFRDQANGSLLPDTHGSALVGQSFDSPAYFWPRLSGAGYNAAASSGTNFAPSNPALVEAAQARIDALKAADPTNELPIPIDLVTASGSGLDPHISRAAAEYQAVRVARARHIDLATIDKMIEDATDHPALAFLGEPGVNVLKLNLELDGQLPSSSDKIGTTEPVDIGWRARGFLTK